MDTCTRCGAFIPSDTATWRTGRFCATCAQRADVLAAGRFVARYAHRRNTWHWLCLAMGLFVAWVAFLALASRQGVSDLVYVAPALVALTLFLRLRLSRVLLFALAPLLAAPLAAERHWIEAVIVLAMMAAFATAVATDPAMRLSLGLEVPHETLERWTDPEHSNPEARSALVLAAASFVVPPLGPLAFARTARALGNLGHVAWPPVGRKGTALAALCLCLACPFIWLALLVVVRGVP